MRHARSGFTIVELLVVLAIIGILVTIALPRYRWTKEKAIRAGMVSDLRNLVTAQEAFLSLTGDYAGGITTGAEVAVPGPAGRISFTVTPGNAVSVAHRSTSGTGPGWSATVTNPSLPGGAGSTCGVFVGHLSYAPNAAVAQAGTPVCY